MTDKPIIRIYSRDAEELLRTDKENSMTPQQLNLADALFGLERHGRYDYGDVAPRIYLDLAVELFQKPESRHAIMRMLKAIDEEAS